MAENGRTFGQDLGDKQHDGEKMTDLERHLLELNAQAEARRNSRWMGQVRRLLREGFGVEDIALKLSCDVADVRREVEILRGAGQLLAVLRPTP